MFCLLSTYLLGICFGHQIIARALGSQVVKNNGIWEIGTTDVKLTDVGKAVFGGEREGAGILVRLVSVIMIFDLNWTFMSVEYPTNAPRPCYIPTTVMSAPRLNGRLTSPRIHSSLSFLTIRTHTHTVANPNSSRPRSPRIQPAYCQPHHRRAVQSWGLHS